jgi:hypothetical protein
MAKREGIMSKSPIEAGKFNAEVEECLTGLQDKFGKIHPVDSSVINVDKVSAYKAEGEEGLKNDLEMKNGKAIYIFSSKQKPDTNKKNKLANEYKLSQENKGAQGDKPRDSTYCLYVGSSKKIRDRLKVHLGIVENKTNYALHLRQWWPDAKVTITVFQFGEEVCQNDMQQMEDLLWNKYKPLFGKPGPKAAHVVA